MWPFSPKRISAADLLELPNPDTLEVLSEVVDDEQFKKLALWRREYAQMYNVPMDQIVTENQLRWVLVFLSENYTVEEALEKAEINPSRANLIQDDIERALDSVDGTPDIIALAEEARERGRTQH